MKTQGETMHHLNRNQPPKENLEDSVRSTLAKMQCFRGLSIIRDCVLLQNVY